MDINKGFLTKLYKAKGYEESLAIIDEVLEDHKSFLSKYNGQVGLSIDDDNFNTRLQDSLTSVEKTF